jgi:hypothetical protein
MDMIRGSNACAALADDDFAELRAIAQLEADSHTWLNSLTALAEKALKKSKKVVALTHFISMILGPVLRTSNQLASWSHIPSDTPGLMGKLGSYLNGEAFHRTVVTASGAAGGFFGPITAFVDVAASTTLVLRSIQEIATSYGEDLSDPQALLDCLMVLSKGGPSDDDDALDEAYWATRASFHTSINPATVKLALESKAMQDFAAKETIKKVLESAVVKKILERYSITTAAAFAEKAIPVIGGAAGAVVNYQFMTYYQNMAHVTYRLKRIETKYESGQVRSCYGQIVKASRKGKGKK